MTRDEAMEQLWEIRGPEEALDLPNLTTDQLRANVQTCVDAALKLYDGYVEATDHAEIAENMVDRAVDRMHLMLTRAVMAFGVDVGVPTHDEIKASLAEAEEER